MVEIHVDPSAKRRKTNPVKWACIVSLGFFGALIFAVFAITIPDLMGHIPTPDAVRIVEMEQSEFDHDHRPARNQDSRTTVNASKRAVLPVQTVEPFIPDLPDLPQTLSINRQMFNDDFTSITREITSLALIIPHLTFEEASSAQRLLFNATVNLNRKFNQAWIDAHGKGTPWDADPSYLTLHRKIIDLFDAIEKLGYENLARHGKWDNLAQLCEYDQWERWPEAVYYWRRHGGIDGYWHIAGGALYVHTRKLPIPGFIRKKLPYQAPVRLVGH